MIVSLYFIGSFIVTTKTVYKKIQAKIIFITTVIPLVFGTLTDVILPVLNIGTFPDLANVFTLVWVVGLILAMVRFKFFTLTPAMAAENIISTMTDALILLNMRGTIVQVNQATLDLLEYKRDDLEGMGVEILFSDEHFIENELPAIKKGQKVVKNNDLILKTKSGENVPVSFSTSALQEEGAFAGLVCIAQDITDRVKASDELKKTHEEMESQVKERTRELSNTNIDLMNEIIAHRESLKELEAEKSYLNNLFDNAPQAIAMSDVDHRIRRINKEFTRLFGFTQEEVAGQLIDSLIVPEEYLEEAQDYSRNVNEGKILNFENIRKRKDNTLLNVSVLVSPITIGNRIVGHYGIYQDITERKDAEAEKRDLKEQLHHSQKMEALGLLAGGVAHDFNNMLTVVSGFTEIIRKKITAEDQGLNTYCQKISEASKRASDLTAKLLAFARKGEFKIVAVDIHTIVKNVISLFEHTVDKRIVITERFHAEQAVVMGDGSQLENAVLNLAVNAQDAMPDGGKLTFTTDNVDVGKNTLRHRSVGLNPGLYLKLTIEDTGVGMDKKTVSRIFEPFFTTKEEGKGTGLGLSSVFGTIETHDGVIDVSSRMGKGTTFTIYLPLAKSSLEDPEGTSGFYLEGRGKILVVDDEELVRDIFRDMLEELGYSIETCTNGKEAVEFYKKNYFDIDLVIIDLMMPKMDGHDCLKALKEINPDIRVIVSSGYSTNSEISNIIDEGALGFIKKPFSAKELSTVIFDIISQGGNFELRV